MTAAQLRRWRWVHKWSSVVSTLFLLILCVTGLPLIFSAEIDALTVPAAQRPPGAPGAGDVPLDRAVAGALAAHPGAVPMSLSWPMGLEHTLVLYTAPRAMADSADFHASVIDLRGGAVIAEPRRGARITDIIHALHAELFAGLPGSLLLCAMGVLFLAALISGAVLYAPFMRRMPFGEIRTLGARRTMWLDIHNFIGVVVLAWTLVVGVTGVANTLAQPLFRLWQGDQLAAMIRPWHDKPVPEHVVAVGTAVATAQRALPGALPESVAYPASRFGSPHHYIVWLKGDTPLTARLETPVLVDAATGVVAEARALPWYLRALEISRPLHFGDYGGLPLKLIWAVLDLAAILVLVTGLVLWLRPRKSAA